MTENLPNIVIPVIFLSVGGAALIGGVARYLKNCCAPVKTVPAVVADKHKAETFSKYSSNGKREEYVVVFATEDKKLAFFVSAFSYRGYRIGQRGMLQYKGQRLLDFQESR